MKRIVITSLAVTLQLAAATAQVTGNISTGWTLDSCMRYAVEHATDVERETINARQRRRDYNDAKAAFLPTVTANVSGQYSWGRNIDPESNTYNNVTTFNNYYQVYASLTLFDGMATINSLRQARLARSYSTTAMQKVKEEKAISVMEKFVEAAYNEESIKIAREKLAESRRLLLKTQRLYELGEKARPDVVEMESQVAEDEYNLTHQQNTSRQALLALKSAMNYPVSDTLRLSIADSKISALPSHLTATSTAQDGESLYATFYAVSPSIKSAEYTVASARYDYRIAKGKLLPSLSLEGGFSTNFYKNLSQGGQYDGFARQLSNNRGEYLVLSLSVPIYNASTWHSVRKARSNWQLAQVALEEAQRKLHDDICQAVMDAQGYAVETVQMEKKVKSDSLAYYMQSRKFEEGMLSTFDLHTSSQKLLESRIKLLQMQLMLIIKQRLVAYYAGDGIIRE